MIDLAILVLRVSMAVVMLPHGWHKFEQLPFLNKKWKDKYGLPPGTALVAGIVEIVCGVALLVGVLSSWASFALLVAMLAGTWTSIWKEHEPYLSLPTGKGWDFNIFLVGTLIALIFTGDGAWSVARLLMP